MLLLLVAALAHADIVLESEPRLGQETVVLVTNAEGESASGETVRVIHRPGLDGERELAVGITDGRGRVRWTPATEGIAVLRAGEERLPVRVAPVEPPRGTLTLAILLGVAAFAALGYGLLPPRMPAQRRGGAGSPG